MHKVNRIKNTEFKRKSRKRKRMISGSPLSANKRPKLFCPDRYTGKPRTLCVGCDINGTDSESLCEVAHGMCRISTEKQMRYILVEDMVMTEFFVLSIIQGKKGRIALIAKSLERVELVFAKADMESKKKIAKNAIRTCMKHVDSKV